ncbi:MAG: cobalt ECF transporter T component CbiQ [Chitinivibrionales bacterium]|nr:cobalt ECF transporter T component CbiQ [Chitinivibrionales bacterium]
MSQLLSAQLDIGYLDSLAGRSSPVHRINPQAKLIVSVVYITILMSFPRYHTVSLLPFVLYPLMLITLGSLPVGYLLRRILFVAPFAIMIGIFNPLFDPHTVALTEKVVISAGWLSFVSILIRFFLTVGTALALIAVTGFFTLCRALERLRVPQVFVMQLMLLYRYIHVLIEETLRMVRAHSLRGVGLKKIGLSTFGSLAGSLLLRSLSRGERVYMAMKCRGFTGQFGTAHATRWTFGDLLFCLGWPALFIGFRLYNIPVLIGELFMKAVLS